MQRIVFRTDDEQTALGGGSDSAAAVTAARYVTPVFPATRAEYEQARAGVETIVRRSDETCSLNVQPVARSAVAGRVESRASVEGSATDASSLSSTATASSLSDAPDPLRLPRLLDAHAGGASPFTTAAHTVLERAGWRFDGACWHGPDCRHPR